MKDFIPVENNPNMARDRNSGAIVYINNNENSRLVKQKKRERIQEQQRLISEVEELKSEMSEIKTLLKKLVEK